MQEIFKSFSKGKTEMEPLQFRQFAKKCKLISKRFTLNDVDIVFSKVKAKGQITITYEDFENSLTEIAKKTGTTVDLIKECIEKSVFNIFN